MFKQVVNQWDAIYIFRFWKKITFSFLHKFFKKEDIIIFRKTSKYLFISSRHLPSLDLSIYWEETVIKSPYVCFTCVLVFLLLYNGNLVESLMRYLFQYCHGKLSVKYLWVLSSRVRIQLDIFTCTWLEIAICASINPCKCSTIILGF